VPPPENILLGTPAFTAEGWVGSFYPKGIQPRGGEVLYRFVEQKTIELQLRMDSSGDKPEGEGPCRGY
jgi:hypothetical protein